MTDKLNRLVLKKVFIPTLVAAISTVIYLMTDFYWGYIIPVIATGITAAVFEFNRQYLLSLTPIKQDDSLVEIVYYNYLDKVKKEEINRTDITEFKKDKKKIKFVLTDNRELKLYFVEDSKLTLGNKL